MRDSTEACCDAVLDICESRVISRTHGTHVRGVAGRGCSDHALVSISTRLGRWREAVVHERMMPCGLPAAPSASPLNAAISAGCCRAAVVSSDDAYIQN